MRTGEDKLEAEETRRSWLLSMPALLILFVGAIGPLFIMLVYSFLAPGRYGNVEWVFSTDAWRGILFSRDIFDDTLKLADAHLTIFWRSVKLSLLTTVFTFLVGFPTAWFIATRAPRWRAFWLFLITIPFWTNLLIRTFAMLEWIRNEGIINQVLIGIGIVDQPVRMLYTEFALMVGLTYVYFPLMVLPLYAAMEKLDFRLVEAAYDLYATRARVLRRIIIPLVRPGIIAGSILVFIPSLGAYVTPRILGGGRNMMIGNFIELQFGQGRNWPLGASLSVVLLVVVTSALLVYVKFANRDGGHG